MSEILVEIDLRFDLLASFEEEEEGSGCSPIGLQFRVFAPFQYGENIPAIYYKLKPLDEVIIQPGMMLKLGTLTFMCEIYNTGVVSHRGNRMRMEDTYAIQQDIGID